MFLKRWITKTMGLMVLALCAGLLAAWSVQRYLQHKTQEIEKQHQLKMVTRVVAAYDLPEGIRLDSAHVAVREVPAEWVPSGSIRPEEFTRLKGQVVSTALKKGDLILWANTAALRQAPFSHKINPGRRAVTIPIDVINSVSGMLVPGDLIDLYVSFEYRRRQITAPLLQGVLVMATGQKSQYAPENQEQVRLSTGQYGTVTLDTSPEEAARLVAARQAGILTALLRNPKDSQTTAKAVRGDLASILGIAQATPSKRNSPSIVFGNQSGKLPSIKAPSVTESPKEDNRGLFDVPIEDDIVSAWIKSLPQQDDKSTEGEQNSETP